MATTTPIQLVGATPSDMSSVHLLPCSIQYDGPAKVDTYFIQETEKDAGKLIAHFRGRRLEGHKIILPRGCVGIVTREISSTTVSNIADTPGSSPSEAAPSKPSVSSRRPASAAPSRGYGGGGLSFGGAGGGGYGRQPVQDSDEENDNEDSDPGYSMGFAVMSEDEDDDEVERDENAKVAEPCEPPPKAANMISLAALLPSKPTATCSDAIDVRRWQLEKAFAEATYWHHDKPISEADTLRAAVDWIQISRVAHGVSTPEVKV